jgi:hypothetical protein
VRASLPHLERAIAIFGTNLPPKGDWQGKPVSTLLPELDALRVELALANRLFENAYLLQAGWAAQAGLNMDGTARQLLYGRRGDGVTGLTPASAAHEVWEA